MTDKLGLDHVNILVEMLAEHALDPTLTSQEYFNDLIASSALPPRWKGEITGQLRGRPMIEARKLVNWAIMRGVNPSQTYLKFPDQTAWLSLSVGYPRTVATRPVSSSE